MNTSQLKTYAPQARKDFIAAVTARAAKFGVTAKHVEPIIEQGDVALIGDKAYPRSVAANRKKLEQRIEHQGFDQVMEAMAYTWFNRLMAIRYMELHGYLDHGRRVLSHPEKKGGFEILDACNEIELPGVDRNQVVDLKMDGSKDEELYRLLLLGQCHALHKAMPFLFEAIEDESELLLPDNLTKTDSLIRDLVDDIPEENWQQVEIIGWLYQFYISEKKDEVIGKVVKSEDIPAATQLFTPNWIVKYMVQNSLGAQWLATYPDSKLKEQMEYYIEPAEQTDEVNAQLKEITPTSLNPEELTLIDPASGSGHILTEAYELFKAIYLERGYRQRDVPQLVLEKNLFGLEICPRAAQLTGFALMMKGRADDRRMFEKHIDLNVMALQNSTHLDVEKVIDSVDLQQYGLKLKHLTGIKKLFEHTTTFGSLIQVPDDFKEKLPQLKRLSLAEDADLVAEGPLQSLQPLVRQAEILAAQYDAVVANPPYMGSKGMNALVKKFAKDNFPDAKSDLFACFIERGYGLAKDAGYNGVVTIQNWMFLSSFEKMRERLLQEKTITTMAQIGYNSFPSMNSKVAQAAVFSLVNYRLPDYSATFTNLNSAPQNEDKQKVFLERDPANRFVITSRELKELPGSPVAYWLSSGLRRLFRRHASLGKAVDSREGMTTADNDRFLRLHHEVSNSNVGWSCSSPHKASDSSRKWFPYLKGGEYRKWYGNLEYLVDWLGDGEDIKSNIDPCTGRVRSHNYNGEFAFREGLTWTLISSGSPSARLVEVGFMFDANGPMAFSTNRVRHLAAGLLNSCVGNALLGAVCPTLTFKHGHILRLPFDRDQANAENVRRCVTMLRDISSADWDTYERSWDFQSLPLLAASSDSTPTIESSYTAWITQSRDTIAEMKRLEEENNRLFIDAYGLADELSPDVPIEQITLTVNPAYRYGGKLTEEEQWDRFRQDSMEELVSYAIGCLMGRYSLDELGLVYAHSGNEGFDPSKYMTFAADDDGIVPVTDTDWFSDDACNRLIEFISIAWPAEHIEANLTFLADTLSPRKTESSRETIRRYLTDKFFKAHLQAYKKRPIYWLFSSGKAKSFQCLVYLHRYNEGTLSRMRTEYVIPLQGKISSRIEQLDNDIASASSTAHRKKLEKERDKLAKQRVELQEFDEKLRHYADQRIKLDLDDGVKVNYGKFGDLLAEVKAVTGKKAG